MGLLSNMSRTALIWVLFFLLAGCASTPSEDIDLPERTYYDKAMEALDDNLPTTAARHLKDLETRYPFGELTERAKLDLIYAQFEAGDYIASHATAERFIRNYPNHIALDYVYYMRALSTYKGAETFLGRYLDLNPAERDANEYNKAFAEFADLLQRYPSSDYAADAKARMIYLRNTIAQHEVQVAHYYFKRKAPLSALRRGKEVIQNYPSTPAVEEALAVTIQAYMDLDQLDLAKLNLSVLINSYPDSRFIDDRQRFIPFELPREADPDTLYWVSLGLID